MTHSMFMAIFSFIIFASIAGGFGYFIWTRSALRSDLGLDSKDSSEAGSGGGRSGGGRRKAD